ncbi:MAG: hypothetical protein HXX11_20955 [Desulfuromonadales bacterium]|nr:hypothetical protein [Desulfuromonadales bacterium]
MTFDEVAAEIVKNSIRTAYAIDDEIIEPYSDQTGDRKMSKELYASFQKVGCSLELARFTTKKKWDGEQKQNLGKKDLLILDWELSKSEPKYANSLYILHQAIQQPGLPFVCIYTHAPDLDVIAKNIFSYFWFGKEDKDSIERKGNDLLSSLQENIADFDEDKFKEIAVKTLDIIKTPSREKSILKEISTCINEVFGKGAKEIIISEGNTLFSMTELKDILICFSLSSCGYLKSGKKTQRIDIFPIQAIGCQYSFLIDNAIVQIYKKIGPEGSVPPGKLYEHLSQAICKRPHNFVSLLGLEFRNYFRDKAKNLGRELNSIDEDAFLYHQECIKKETDGDDHFSFFMKDIWNSQVTGDWHGHSPKTLEVIEDYKAEHKFDERLTAIIKTQGNDISAPLAYLNKRYSMLRWEPTPPSSLRFGDIFKTSSPEIPYLLCITSHCDCLRPKKINDMFLFVAGKIIATKNGLMTGDEGFQSFIRDDSSNVICLAWEDKPFSLHIETSNLNLLKPVKAKFKNEKIELMYQCTQRENYTQRIANHAFGNAGRVGITFANLKEFKTKKPVPCKNPEGQKCMVKAP